VEDDYFCPTCGNYAQKEPGKCPQCGSMLESLVGVSRENGDYVDDDLLGGLYSNAETSLKGAEDFVEDY
jgi:predicted ATP-dependent serine protease